MKEKLRRKHDRPAWVRACWWNRGHRHKNTPNHYILKHLGGSPWWVQGDIANTKVEGKNNPRHNAVPHFAFYKCLPILGWNGWGTKQGEITVEDRYTEIGLDQLQWWVDSGMLNPNETITPNTLIESKAIEDYHWPGLKLIKGGCTWFKAALDIEVEMADVDAIKAVEAAGGSVVTRWRDNEGIVKEKFPWRFPVIPSSPLPPQELLQQVYASDERRGYLSGFYEKALRAHTESPREWALSSRPPHSDKELPPDVQVQLKTAPERSAKQVSLKKKQEYWEDFLAGTANSPAARYGLLTPSPFPIWEHTYFKTRGTGHNRKREPPAGQEVVVFPGYPFRDPRYFQFVETRGGSGSKTRTEHPRARDTADVENPYKVTEMDFVMEEQAKGWKDREGWRTEADKNIRYRNPYSNPYLKKRIEAWMKREKKESAARKKTGKSK